jgi:cobalt-zinc-cadmium efflux system membrane fusion protein
LLCVLAACAAGCGNKAGATTATEPPATAKTARQVVVDQETAKRLGITTRKAGEVGAVASISVPGTVEYDLAKYAEVGPRLDGRILTVKVKLGDHVKAGDLLAEMAVPTLAEAQASLLTSSAMLAAAQKNADREKDLLGKNLTTAREAELADADLNKAKAEAAAARARLEALGVGKGGPVGGAIRLVSPIDGTVVQRQAVIGAFIGMNQNAFVIADVTSLIATLDVHESDLPYLQLGSEVVFTADGLPGRSFTGKLTYIDPTVNKLTRIVRARVQVANPDDMLRPGMFIRAAINIPTTAEGGIPLPPQAVQPLGNDDIAFVERAPGTYEIRKLVLGRRTSEVVEVKEGISRGETIVVEGAFLLRGEAAKQ